MPDLKNRRLNTTAQRGRLTDAEKRRLEDALPQYQVNEAFFKNPPQNLEVELGMGNGLALLERAKAAPERHFLGCELYQAGIATCLYHIGQNDEGFQNVSLDNGDARDLLAALPKGSANRVLLPHPDPWPKARHHKRRLLQADFLDAVNRVLEPGGEFWVITDWPDYADHSLEILKIHDVFKAKVVPAPAWWVETKYQQKAQKAGRGNTFIKAVAKA
ncbi:MAG TPA: tRNA (guanosine(46)-N7)-methyltransferase TrmB [Alphaproteobacteria bacterium]|nr:tRNA (guanosine(46)-N7)-methyltransferase TrmB [Alphaproteobacteria bacterium]